MTCGNRPEASCSNSKIYAIVPGNVILTIKKAGLPTGPLAFAYAIQQNMVLYRLK
jgi:hypothetical protein